MFADLPAVGSEPTGQPVRPRLSAPVSLVWLGPLLLVALLVAVVIFQAPWLLWGLFWLAMVGGFWGRGRGRFPSGHNRARADYR